MVPQAGLTSLATYMVRKADLRETRGDRKPYWGGEVFDKEGTYNFVCWEGSTFSSAPAPGDLIEGRWACKEYQGKPQLTLEARLALIPSGSVTDPSPYIRGSAITKEEWTRYYVSEVYPLIEDEPIRELVRLLVLDRDDFFRAAAAKGMHQNWRGGLAEHVHRMLRLFVGLVQSGHPTVAKCRKSLVIAGIIFHDWGKAKEYVEIAPGQFDVGRWGSLVGHLAGGPLEIQRAMTEAGITMSEELRLHFFHVLFAHHGRLDWGSPVTPQTKEATIVHYLDNMDGKLSAIEEMADMTYNRATGGTVVHFAGEEP